MGIEGRDAENRASGISTEGQREVQQNRGVQFQRECTKVWLLHCELKRFIEGNKMSLCQITCKVGAHEAYPSRANCRWKLENALVSMKRVGTYFEPPRRYNKA